MVPNGKGDQQTPAGKNYKPNTSNKNNFKAASDGQFIEFEPIFD
jgi:hypothetical protein